ncbi:hypothetical protein Y032_0109g96 [Ancylostoma ceylanicum]|uniref:Uncharacterized protein n=1 Tax=Ancylostoma ceylanicum TaxID=53326 RepID=A0A016TF55_9BILA|nr:hypothetical protein Y032_0109g96 [Ancylostoma ceylanicum]
MPSPIKHTPRTRPFDDTENSLVPSAHRNYFHSYGGLWTITHKCTRIQEDAASSMLLMETLPLSLSEIRQECQEIHSNPCMKQRRKYDRFEPQSKQEFKTKRLAAHAHGRWFDPAPVANQAIHPSGVGKLVPEESGRMKH